MAAAGTGAEVVRSGPGQRNRPAVSRPRLRSIRRTAAAARHPGPGKPGPGKPATERRRPGPGKPATERPRPGKLRPGKLRPGKLRPGKRGTGKSRTGEPGI